MALGRTGQWVGFQVLPRLAQQQFRTGADQHAAIGQIRQEVIGLGILLAQPLEDRRRTRWLIELQLQQSGQHRLVQPAVAQFVQCAHDRLLETDLVGLLDALASLATGKAADRGGWRGWGKMGNMTGNEQAGGLPLVERNHSYQDGVGQPRSLRLGKGL